MNPGIKGHIKFLTNLGNIFPLVSDQLKLNILCVLLGALYEFRKFCSLVFLHVRGVYI